MMNEMKHGRSALLALLLLCLSLFILTVPRAADAADIGNARVIDEADLLTDAEEQELDASIAAFEKAHGVRILVGNIKDTHGQVLGKVANAVYALPYSLSLRSGTKLYARYSMPYSSVMR